MRKAIALNILLGFLIISLDNPFFAAAGEKTSIVIDEQKLKVMLEEFVDENSADPIIQRYGFDMTKSFLKMDLREDTIEEHRFWSLGPWTVYVDKYGKGNFIVNQSVSYGPGMAIISIEFISYENKYKIVDESVHIISDMRKIE